MHPPASPVSPPRSRTTASRLPALRNFAGEFKDNKKAPQLRTIQASIKLISGFKKKK